MQGEGYSPPELLLTTMPGGPAQNILSSRSQTAGADISLLFMSLDHKPVLDALQQMYHRYHGYSAVANASKTSSARRVHVHD